MTKTLESIAAAIIFFVVVVTTYTTFGLFTAIIVAIIMGVLTFIILFLRRIPFDETWVVDRMGVLIEKKSGYKFIITAFGFEIIKRKVKIIEYGLTLFQGDPGEEAAGIDLTVGGKVFLIDPVLWIKVNNPITAVQAVTDFEELIREVVEHRIRGFINRLEPDEMLEIILYQKEEDQISKRITKFLEADAGLGKTLTDVATTYKGFTLTYFNFDKTIESKRVKRVEADMDIAIEEKKVRKAEKTAEAQEAEMSAISKTAKKLVEELGIPMELATQIAVARQQDIIVAERGDLKKVIWSSGDKGLNIAEIAAQFAMGQELSQGKKKKGEKE